MVSKYCRKYKEKIQKKHVIDFKIFLKKKKIKGEKRSEIDIKFFLKKRRKNNVSI